MPPVPANASDAPAAKAGARTLGGLLLWRDVAVAHGWRVQVQVRTHKARLLDPDNRCIAAGTLADCRAEFHAAIAGLPLRRAVTVVLHPMAGGRYWMRPTERLLQGIGQHTESFGYASLVEPVATHAAALSAIIDSWQDVTDIALVTLSLGGVVVAHMLASQPAWRQRITLRAVVMMGPPAQGAALARIGITLPGTQRLLGPALATLAAAPMPTAGLQNTPVLIIAGRLGLPNPLIEGDSDGIVGVSETRIDVPHSHLVVRASHAGLQRNRAAQAALKEFIATRMPVAPYPRGKPSSTGEIK